MSPAAAGALVRHRRDHYHQERHQRQQNCREEAAPAPRQSERAAAARGTRELQREVTSSAGGAARVHMHYMLNVASRSDINTEMDAR